MCKEILIRNAISEDLLWVIYKRSGNGWKNDYWLVLWDYVC